MKTIKYNIFILACFALSLIACNEDERLKEVPYDFYSPENSFVTKADFGLAINRLYWQVRSTYWSIEDCYFGQRHGNDFAFQGTDVNGALNNYKVAMIPTNSNASSTWTNHFKIIYDANTIISRVDASFSKVEEADRPLIKAEAMFFRAYAYSVLGHLFGGVPVLKEEVAAPRRDYVRDTRENVYAFCIEDLEEAVRLLPDIDKTTDGKVSKQAAQHLLSEMYICVKQWDNAINAASQVINYSAMGLMKDRFGNYKDKEGDVYWDMFRRNNQNRKNSGNTETIWTLQYDYNNAGSRTGANWNWAITPVYTSLVIDGIPLFESWTNKKGGNPLGWLRPTSFFFYELWGEDIGKDIRNSAHNMLRDIRIDNPKSDYFGKWLVKDGINKNSQLDTIQNWFPIMTKTFWIYDYPAAMYNNTSAGDTTAFGERRVSGDIVNLRIDEYVMRLAETYLLRAEAYIGKGSLDLALADVNELRSRAQATPATISDMNIDYILDERLRELYIEEKRTATLCRLGKLVERCKKYNIRSGATIEEYHNLWPIPYSEIERNSQAVLEQNTGYVN